MGRENRATIDDARNPKDRPADLASDLVSVVVPVRNGSSELRRCLEALTRCRDRCEIVVVDDHSTEKIREIAARYQARYLEMPEHGGPAAARNLGAKYAHGEVLVFVDADVLLPPDGLRIIVDEFHSHPDIVALFGSYDDAPARSDFWSSFKNLMHHHVHQSAKPNASTFWTGCGAIRKQAFEALGGFDAIRYTEPSIEDIELGVRLTQRGQPIRLVKRLQVKHLKRWTLRSMVQTDLFRRAVPWTQLIVRTGRVPRDLNLTWASRVSAALVAILAALLVGLLADFVGLLSSPPRVFAIGLTLASSILLLLNRDLYRLYWRKRGPRFAAGAILAHWFYFLYSGAAFVCCFAVAILQSRLRPTTGDSKFGRLRRTWNRLTDAN